MSEAITLARQDRRLGLLFGLLAGLAYALAAWGYEGYTLAGWSIALPWWKLAAGGVLCLILGTLAGWLTGLSDNSLAGLVVWILAGSAMAWITGHLPFEGQSWLAGWLDPRFRDLSVYPISQAGRIHTGLVVVVVGGLGALAGALQLTYHEWMRGAQSLAGQVLVVMVWLPFFVIGGYSADSQINQPLRAPLGAVDQLLDLARQAQITPVDQQTAQQQHLRAARPIEDLLSRPRIITLGGYDPVSMLLLAVEVDFDGTWARCIVLSDQPTFCRRTDEIFEQGLACWLESPGLQGARCPLILSASTQAWLRANQGSLGASPQVMVQAVMGEVVLAEVRGQDGGRSQCHFRGVQPLLLEQCRGFD